MGNTSWVTDVKNKGLWELWETAFVAVFQGAVDAFCVRGSGSFHGRFSELWGARAEQRPRRRLQERRSTAALTGTIPLK